MGRRDRHDRHRREREPAKGGSEEEKVAAGELVLEKEDERVIRTPTSIEEIRELLGSKTSRLCPNCGMTVEEYYHCSFCGQEYCDSCAESSGKNEGTVYKCPNCGKKNMILKENPKTEKQETGEQKQD